VDAVGVGHGALQEVARQGRQRVQQDKGGADKVAPIVWGAGRLHTKADSRFDA